MKESEKTAAWDTYRELVPINEDPKTPEARRLKDDIILSYLPLALRMAAKMLKNMPAYVDKDDIESYTKLGLIRAVTRYNHTIGVPFESYAITNMRSVVLDGLRSLDWAPRSLRKKERELFNTRNSLATELGKIPSVKNIAERMGVSEAEVNDIQKKSFASISKSLEEESSEKTLSTKLTCLTTEEEAEVISIREAVSQAVKALPFKQAVVIALYYYQGKTLAQVALDLGISEVKAGTLHTEAVVTIWQKLEGVRN